jgi:hypothetical protein
VTSADSAAGDAITRAEWLQVAAAVLGVGGTVYATRNRDADEPVLEGDRGAIDPGSMALGLVVGFALGIAWHGRFV